MGYVVLIQGFADASQQRMIEIDIFYDNQRPPEGPFNIH